MAIKSKRKKNGVSFKIIPVMLVVGLVVALIQIAAALSVMAQRSNYVAGAYNKSTQEIAQVFGANIGRLLQDYNLKLTNLAADKELGQWLRADIELSSKEDKIKRIVFPQAQSVHLVRAPDITVSGSKSGFSFADMTMIEKALQGDSKIDFAVHQFGTTKQHIAIAAGVVDGAERVGVVFLNLPVALLRLPAIGVGYFEIVQVFDKKSKPFLLGSQGNAGLRDDAAAGHLPIAGSLWQLSFWYGGSEAAAWSMTDFGLFGMMLVMPMLVIFAGFLAISKVLEHDQQNIVVLIKDFIDGKVKKHYPIRLQDNALLMVQLLEITNASMRDQKIKGTMRPGHDRATPAPSIEQNTDVVSEPNPLSIVKHDGINDGDTISDVPVNIPFERSAPMATFAEDAPETATSLPDDNWEMHSDLSEQPSDNDGVVEWDFPSASGSGTKEMEVAGAIVPASIFRSYDIRGIVGDMLTVEGAYVIGRAIGSEARALGQQMIVLGRDGRLSTPELAEAVTQGLTTTGCDVIDIGLVPTPILYFATCFLPTSSGVMVTASHNPAQYNGFKIVLRGETLSGDAILNLHNRISRDDYVSGSGVVKSQDISSEYIARIVEDVRLVRAMKVVVDCGNGVAGKFVPLLFQSLGCEVIELFCDIDGNFPNHHPDPSEPENLVALVNAVKEHGAEIGLAFDGDGDRLGVVDSDGAIVWPDRQMMLFSSDVLSRNPGGDIVYDVKCSRHLAREIVRNGGRPVMWKSGHSLIKAKIKETGALLGGEMSGHIFFKERWYGFDDALYASARLLEILSLDFRSTSDVFAELPQSINTPMLTVSMQEGEPHQFMQRLVATEPFKEAELTVIDGIRADFADGWGLVRASNTTPSLVLRFEADDELALKRIQQVFKQTLLAVDSKLRLPI